MDRSKLRLLAGLLVILLVLAACGGDSGTTGDTPAAPAPTDEPADAPSTDPPASDEVVEVVMVAGAVGSELESIETALVDFNAMHPNIKVNVIAGPDSATDRLGLYLQDFAAQAGEFDILQIDVIWPGDLAAHLVDMKQYAPAGEVEKHFPAIVENNTVDGALVGIPWFTDAGLMYFRTDLLDKYGYDGPPETWTELTEMAETIQAGERDGGNPDFVGYVWQGNAYEGLTCDAIEWLASSGGGTIVSPDKVITVNNDNAVKAIELGASWVGTISPEGVTGFQEEDARNIWQAGNAAFMRNWPYAYSLGQNPDEGSQVVDKFDVAPLPRAEGSPTGAACLGGWQLAVSKYSDHPEEAAMVAWFLASTEVQKSRAINQSLNPTIQSLYSDPDVLAATPFFGSLYDVFINATPRPSTATAPNYNEVSNLFFDAVHSVITGQADADDALAELELNLEDLLGYETGTP